MRDRETTRSSAGRTGRSVFGWLLGVVVISGGSWGIANAQEASPGDRLARYAPRQKLVAYLEYEGLDAHPDAWHATAAYRILTETKMGALLEDLARQGIEMAYASADAPPPIKTDEIVALAKLGASKGGVMAFWGQGPKDLKAVFVVRGGDQPVVRRLIDLAEASSRKEHGQDGAARTAQQKAGRTLHPAGDDVFWWVEKGDLVFSDDPDSVLAVLDGKAPNAIDHPIRTALAKSSDGFQPALVGFLDMAGLPPMPPDAVKLGLGAVKRFEVAWGFQDDAMRSVIRAVVPAPRRGILALFDQPAFTIDSLPPIPPDLTGFTVVSIDLAKTYDRVLDIVKTQKPEMADQIPAIEGAIEQQLGVNLRNDILARIGPKASFSMEMPAGAMVNPMMAMLSLFNGVTLTFEARDEAALAKSLDTLIARVNDLIRQQQAARGGNAPAIEFTQAAGQKNGYVLNFPPGTLPPGPLAGLQPTILLGSDRLAIGATTPAANKAMQPKAPDDVWKPTGAFVPVARRLPPGMIYLTVSDPRESIPGVVAMIPTLAPQINAAIAAERRKAGKPAGPMLHIAPDQVPTAEELTSRLFPSTMAIAVDDHGISLVGRESVPGISSPASSAVVIALLLPAVQSAREAARRAQCTNNHKQIGLAMHNYESATGAFPRPAITDKDGKPLLSWRVAILPYIEQQSLYNKFKQDEPWDSPHNKALIKEMPQTYLCPSWKSTGPGMTTYQVFQGPGTMFEPGKGTRIAQVTDGTSNTILVVEAKDAVPWTKPDDIAFDPAAAGDRETLFGAFSNHPGGFNALFADGSVHFIKRTINLQTLKFVITRSGGEVISSDQY
ncbi:MAG: DUF1559 domain-containing protein [Isosphaeraceae bacterium]